MASFIAAAALAGIQAKKQQSAQRRARKVADIKTTMAADEARRVGPPASVLTGSSQQSALRLRAKRERRGVLTAGLGMLETRKAGLLGI